jgi:antitoxin (DNA-binding transcriptional repressor) of toxin-antitoxin stability system
MGAPNFVSMTTQFIGIKEFRQNISKLASQARRGTKRFILTRNSEPVFEVRPIPKAGATLEALAKRLKEAEADIKEGNYYTQAQIEKMIGL